MNEPHVELLELTDFSSGATVLTSRPQAGHFINAITYSQPSQMSDPLRDSGTRMQKSVPQTNHTQTEFDFDAVKLEPELQMEAATFTPHQRRVLACVYERWAHQLRVSAKVLEARRRSSPRGTWKPLPRRKLAWN
jgi:hypothetical protein